MFGEEDEIECDYDDDYLMLTAPSNLMVEQPRVQETDRVTPVFFFFILFSSFNRICPAIANSVDSDQLTSKEGSWPGSALFVIKCVNLIQQPGSNNLISWNIEVEVAS